MMYYFIHSVHAMQCNAMQVIGTELFGLLREKHGAGFQQLIQDKVAALPGDIIYENLGLLEAQDVHAGLHGSVINFLS